MTPEAKREWDRKWRAKRRAASTIKPSEQLNTIPREEILAALAPRQSKPDANGCIRWTGRLSTPGYGMLSWHSRRFPAHRAAWVAKNGPMDAALEACHTCDNRWCVNPDHVFPGTRSDNMQDAKRKGRISRRQVVNAHGETHWNAKLNREKVASIRALRKAGATRAELAVRFGVHPMTISRITSNKLWRAKEIENG